MIHWSDGCSSRGPYACMSRREKSRLTCTYHKSLHTEWSSSSLGINCWWSVTEWCLRFSADCLYSRRPKRSRHVSSRLINARGRTEYARVCVCVCVYVRLRGCCTGLSWSAHCLRLLICNSCRRRRVAVVVARSGARQGVQVFRDVPPCTSDDISSEARDLGNRPNTEESIL